MEDIVVQPYDWVQHDPTEKISYSEVTVGKRTFDHQVIHAWCLDRESRPVLVRFNNFPVSCYLELPQLVRGRVATWNKSSASQLFDEISYRLRDKAPYSWEFVVSTKSYYYQNSGTAFLKLSFPSVDWQRNFINCLTSKPFSSRYFGDIRLSVLEAESQVSSVRKLLTTQGVGYAQWFSVRGYRAREVENKISTQELEYIAEWGTMKPVPPSECEGWTTHPRLLAFDIECYSNNHRAMPDEWCAAHVAYMISCIYQREGAPETRQRYGIIYGSCNQIPPGQLEKTILIQTEGEYGEIDMIMEFGKLIQRLDPEIILGYNIVGFDYRYLDARLTRTGTPWPQVSRLIADKPIFGKALDVKKWKSGAYGWQSIHMLKAEGRISIDLLPVVKRDNKLDKYDLDTVSRHFLKGRGKHEVKAVEMFQIYERNRVALSRVMRLKLEWEDGPEFEGNPEGNSEGNPEGNPEGNSKNEAWEKANQELLLAREEMTRVMSYCIQDSELVIDLFAELTVWIGLVEMSNIVGTTLVDLFTRGQQIRCVSQLYNLAHSKGFILDKRDVPGYKFGGGFVFEPCPGIYENVICLDFASLYPSIIQAYNICYTTLIRPGLDASVPDSMCNVIEFDQEEPIGPIGSTQEIPDFDSDGAEIVVDIEREDKGEKEELDNDKKPAKKTVMVHHRFRFIKEEYRKGLLPQLVKNLVAERNAVRAQQRKCDKKSLLWTVLEKRQLALKVSANSFFGFLGVHNGGKMPLIEAAMSITAKGRQLIEAVFEYVKEKYNGKIIYADTDTLMGTSPILFKNKNGEIDYCQIKDLFNLPPADDSTEQEIYDQRESGVQVWSDLGWTPIKYIMRHRTNKKLYRVLTHTGLVDVTEDHSLLRQDGSEVRGAEIYDVHAENAKRKKVAEAEIEAKISGLPGTKAGLLQKEKAERAKFISRQRGEKTKEWWDEIPNRLLHRDLPQPEEIYHVRPEHAWVMGLFFAEGTCGHYRRKIVGKCKEESSSHVNSWSISNQNLDLLSRAQEILKEMEPDYLFITDPCMSSSGVDKLNARSGPAKGNLKDLVNKWRRMFYTGDCNTDDITDKYKKVPLEIMNGTRAARCAFFEGFWDGDGSKTGPGKKFDIKGHISAAGLNYIASSIGYNFSLNIRETKPDVVLTNISPASVKQRYDTDQVKKIFELPTTDDYVYDLETENHHFAAGVGRMIVHNSCMAVLPCIQDRSECNYWGERLSVEISGTPEERDAEGKITKAAVPGLFPPPLRMEFEKAMRMLCLKKKKYASYLIDKNGKFKHDPVTGVPMILKRGIVLARRDNCHYLRDVYSRLLGTVLDRKPFAEALDILFEAVINLMEGRVDYRKLLVTRELGANYKDENYFMKVFADDLRLAEKPVNPGDRLEFLIVEMPGVKHLGHRLRLTEQYLEALAAGEELRVDNKYYLEKVLKNPIDQLISVGYQEDLAKLQWINYTPPRCRKPITLDNLIGMICKILEEGHSLQKFREELMRAVNTPVKVRKTKLEDSDYIRKKYVNLEKKL